MRVLLTSHGSTGDIVPMISLGVALQKSGHAVKFATTRFFQKDIEAAGIDFVRLPPDWDAQDFAEAMRDLHRAKTPLRQLRLIYGSAKPFLGEALQTLETELADADILIGSYLFPSFESLAQKAGKKFAVVTFCHNTVGTEDMPPDMVPALDFLPDRIRKAWNRFWWNISEAVLDVVMDKELGDVIRQAGLEVQKGFCRKPAPLAIVAVSPSLMKTEGVTYPECFQFVGYMRYQQPQDDAFEQTLENFTGGQRVPVITFGSVTWDSALDDMQTFLSNWPKGKKLILQAGWANFGQDADMEHILVVKKCSHDQLFRHASVVMHHGGAGTTASVLHAGVPHLVAPQIADQNFWAKQVLRLGVGLRASPQGWPTHAPRLLQRLEDDKGIIEKAQACAEQLKREDGPATAVQALEKLVGV